VPTSHPAVTFVMAHPSTVTLDRLGGDLAAGRPTLPVERTYPLAELPAAFGDFVGGTLGKPQRRSRTGSSGPFRRTSHASVM
jgi:hypothetical protein